MIYALLPEASMNRQVRKEDKEEGKLLKDKSKERRRRSQVQSNVPSPHHPPPFTPSLSFSLYLFSVIATHSDFHLVSAAVFLNPRAASIFIITGFNMANVSEIMGMVDGELLDLVCGRWRTSLEEGKG